MSVPKHTQRVQWTGPAQSTVICTGDFDGWKGSQLLSRSKEDPNRWVADIPVERADEDKEIKYKFVVDGTWRHAPDQPQVSDDAGNVNNVFTVPSKSAAALSASATPALGESSSKPDEVAVEAPGAVSGTEEANGDAAAAAEQDLPNSLSDLLGSANDGGGGENGQQQNFQTFNINHLASIRHLDIVKQMYPSPFLLETPPITSPDKIGTVTPSDLEVGASYIMQRYRALMEKSPEPGILKILARLKEDNPEWTLSEKRLRKVVKDQKAMVEAERLLRLAGIVGTGPLGNQLVPVSSLDPRLMAEVGDVEEPASEINKVEQAVPSASATGTGASANSSDKENDDATTTAEATSNSKASKKKGKKTKSTASQVHDTVSNAASKVAATLSSGSSSSPAPANGALSTASRKPVPADAPQVGLKWFDDVKGRGVVARKDFKKGTVLFKEDAFVFAPTRTIQSAIDNGQGCGYCGKLFLGKSTALQVPCTAHEGVSSRSSGAAKKVPGKKPLPGAAAAAAHNNNKKVSSKTATAQQTPTKDAEASSDVATQDKGQPKTNNSPVCKTKFCNKLCRDRSNEVYSSLLCPVVNPSYAALLRWAESTDSRNGKQNTIAVFKIYLRLIVACLRHGFNTPFTIPSTIHSGPSGITTVKEMLESLECLTAVNERSRRKIEMNIMADLQFGSDWMTAHRLVMEALQLPEQYYEPVDVPDAAPATKPEDDGTTGSEVAKANADKEDPTKDSSDPAEQVPLPPNPGSTIQRSPALPEFIRTRLEKASSPDSKGHFLPKELTDHLVGLTNFLVWLGRVGLNQEDDGGVYLLHPCLNHSCDANAIVKRTPSLTNSGAREAKPSRIYIVAQKDIAAGEEITISYVSPTAPVEVRRTVLQNHYLFPCACERCQYELAEKASREQGEASGATATAAASGPQITLPQPTTSEDKPEGETKTEKTIEVIN